MTLNNIYFYVIPALIITLLLIDIYIRFNQKKIIEKRNKEADERELERAKKFYNKLYDEIIEITKNKNNNFIKTLTESLKDKETTTNRIKKLEEQHKELLNIIYDQQKKIKKQSLDLMILIEKEARKSRANERLKNKIFNLDKKIKELEK
jgi:DNA-binding helix-hairpin-helix protein with protein kinase domain